MDTFWFVESQINGCFDGWWTGVPKGTGGWLTQNWQHAKQYTEAEAKAVAAALDYFPSPFPYSHWIATEHSLIERAEPEREGHQRGCICADCSGAELTSNND